MEADLERDALVAELSWFLGNEFTHKVAALGSLMQECSKKFSAVLNSSSGGGDLRPSILLTSPHQGDAVLCTAAIEGDKIAKAEINLKLPGRSSKPLRTTIKEHSPWKLKQIQDSTNYFQQAEECYHEIKTSKFTSPSQINTVFEKLASWLRLSENVLVLPRPTTALDIYTADQKNHLRPELPDDVCVNFHISSAMLVLTVLCVTHVSRQHVSDTAHSVGSGAGEDSTSWVGSVFDYGSSSYEVCNQLQVKSQVPWLSSVSKLLQETLELTQDLIDKVKVFEPTETR